MKKQFAANWISAARAVSPAPNASVTGFHTMRPGIALAAARSGFVVSEALRD